MGVCQRCGSFTCLQCRQLNPQFCPKCAERRAAFFFNRDNLHIIDLLSATWNNAFKPYWVELSVAAFLTTLIPSIVSYILQIPIFFLGMGDGMMGKGAGAGAAAVTGLAVLTMGFAVVAALVQILLQMSLQRGLVEMAHAAWNGHRPAFGVLFNFKAGLKVVAASWLVGLPAVVLIAMLAILMVSVITLKSTLILALGVFLIVSVSLALGIWLLPTVLLMQPFAENPDIGIMEGIRLCFERGRGQRLNIFLVALMSGFLILLGFFALCIGVIPAMGLAFSYQTGLWKALSTPGASSA